MGSGDPQGSAAHFQGVPETVCYKSGCVKMDFKKWFEKGFKKWLKNGFGLQNKIFKMHPTKQILSLYDVSFEPKFVFQS